MIELVTYRARIGCFNLRRKCCRAYKTRCLDGTNYRGGSYLCGLLLLYIGIMTAVLVLDSELSKLTDPSNNVESRIGYISHQVSVIAVKGFSNKVNWLSCSHCVSDWNSHMRATNGNTKTSVTVAHWNGGSSFLGKSERGREKLEEI